MLLPPWAIEERLHHGSDVHCLIDSCIGVQPLIEADDHFLDSDSVQALHIHQVENTHIKDLLQGPEAQIAKVISDDPIIFFEPLCRAGVDVYFVIHVNHSYRVL